MHQIENEAIPGQPRTAIPRKCLPTAKSRGPATTEGQRRSSMNALKHGLTARTHTSTSTSWRSVDPTPRPTSKRSFTTKIASSSPKFKMLASAPSNLSEIIQCRMGLRRHQIARARLLDRAMFDNAESFAIERDLCNATEDERIAAALEHTPGLLHTTDPLSRQIGQTLRNQRWLVRELREYRKQKLDPDQGGGEGDNTSERTTSIGRRETEQQPHTSELHPRHRARSLRERLPAADARKQRPRRAGKAPQSTQ